uniref:DUF1618 domain-containing protein n=2 Tax=Hordeum vulgare subsp. vulgare TaxID=112509 RepID=A0A8I6WL77_HORVV
MTPPCAHPSSASLSDSAHHLSGTKPSPPSLAKSTTADSSGEMLLPLPLRRLSGPLRRSLSTAASRPAWAMVYRISTVEESARGASLSLVPPPLPSRVTIPKRTFALDQLPAADRRFINVFGSSVLAASGDGLLLLDAYKNRANAFEMFEGQVPTAAPFEVLDQIYERCCCSGPMRLARFVCNPVTGEMVRIPDFDGVEETYTASTGLLTQPDIAHGPPKRYAAAQLSTVDGGRRFLLRRLSSETGKWDELVLPSPLPPGRRMHMNHEVLDFGGRLWWVDVSWGAVNVDPFSDRPVLCPVELPAASMLPTQQSKTEMWQLLLHRRMGVSDGNLRFVEVSEKEPFRIKSFKLDDESGRWTLEHHVLWRTLYSDPKATPLIAAIDPLDADLLHLTVLVGKASCLSVDLTVPVGKALCLSVDMLSKRPNESTALGGGVHPSKCTSSFVLPCVLPSFLGSSSIPGKNDLSKNKTLADVLVRSGKQPKV